MSDARTHAVTASEMLDSIDRSAARMRELDAHDRLQMAVTGEIKRYNADLEWTAKIAIAHALTAIAMSVSSQNDAAFLSPGEEKGSSVG